MTSQAVTGPADIRWVGSRETLRQAGHRMSDLGLVALPVRDNDDSIRGVLSREMILACIAAGGDPNIMRASDIAH